MNIGEADRVLVTTWDAEGTPTSSAQFVVSLDDDRVGLWMPDAVSWVDRLAHSDVVSVQAATSTGRPLRDEPVLEGRAVLVHEGSDFDTARALTHDKYGLTASVADVVDWVRELGGPKTPPGVIIVRIVW